MREPQRPGTPGSRFPHHAFLLGLLGVTAFLASSVIVQGAEREKANSSAARGGTAADQVDVIDRLIEAGWNKAGVRPARAATDEEYVRRIYLDVVGRIPSVSEVTAFLQTRESGKREKLVGYLLNHPDFGKNFATNWTVLLIGRKNQGRMVDRAALTSWLRKQFSSDRPWNEVVYDLIAAQGSNKSNGAVNYALAHLESDAVPLTSRTTRLFLGQQIQCTQCHDHPSNSWKQGDFWGINAFFKGVKTERVRGVNDSGAEVDDHTELTDEPTEVYARFDKRNGMVGVALPKYLDGRKIDEGGDVFRLVELAKLIADPKNPALAPAFVNRLWAHFMGRGFVNPVDDFGSHNPASHPELLAQLAEDFRSSGYNVKKLVRRIVLSRPYQLSSLGSKSSDAEIDLFNRMLLKPMTPEQLFESLLTATAVHRSAKDDETDRRRDNWMRQFLFTFANDEAEEGSSFQGTIPQALMMMNGDLIDEAVSGKRGGFLADVYTKAVSRGRAPEAYMVNQIYLSVLSRLPTRNEASMVGQFLMTAKEPIKVLQDLFWALLNSNEFVLNH